MDNDRPIPRYEPKFHCYRSLRDKGFHSITFQFSLDEVNLFKAKMKGKHPSGVICIGNGSEAHFSRPDYTLSHNSQFTRFVLKDNQGHELMTVSAGRAEGRQTPISLQMTWFCEDGTTISLKSKTPDLTDSGVWMLDFEGRFACPSVKNCIMIDSESSQVQFMVRKINGYEMNVDSLKKIPPLCLFAVLLCLNVCVH